MKFFKFFNKTKIKIKGCNFGGLIEELRQREIKFDAKKISGMELELNFLSNYEAIIFDLLDKKCYDYTIIRKSNINGIKAFCVIFGVLFSMGLICGLSCFCLGISVECRDVELGNRINTVLEDLGVMGHSWKDLDLNNLEFELKERLDSVSMVNLSRRGVYLVCYATKFTEKDEMREDEILSQGLLASQDGVVSRIFVSQGTAIVSVGDVVSAGQLLVEPYKLNSEGEKVLCEVRAEVYLYVWESVLVEFCEEGYDFIRTGKKIENVITSFMGDVISKKESNVDFEHFEIERRVEYISSVLPVKCEYEIFYETEPVVVNKEFESEKEALIYEAKQKLYEKINQIDILEEKHTISQVGNKYFINYYGKKEIKI